MSVLHPSRTVRRILKLASLGVAGLIAGLLAGCSGTSTRLAIAPNDTGWQTPSTYASATAALSPRQAVRTTRIRFCSGAPCASVPRPATRNPNVPPL